MVMAELDTVMIRIAAMVEGGKIRGGFDVVRVTVVR
jgi:hypothetical protein